MIGPQWLSKSMMQYQGNLLLPTEFSLQDCLLSPQLFSVVLDTAITMNQDMLDDPENVEIQDEAVLDFEFVDDLGLLGTSPDHLQGIMRIRTIIIIINAWRKFRTNRFHC